MGDRVLNDNSTLHSLGLSEDSTLTMVTVMAAGRSVILPEIDKRYTSALPSILETLQTLQAIQQQSNSSSNNNNRCPSVFVVMRQPTAAPASSQANNNNAGPGGASGRRTSRTARGSSSSFNNNNTLPSIAPMEYGGGGSSGGTTGRSGCSCGGESSSSPPESCTEQRVSSSALGLNRLKGEMLLYGKRIAAKGEVGILPYSYAHLETYVRLKVRFLQEGKG